MPQIKLTQPQSLVLHLIESIIASAILTALFATYQYTGTHGLDYQGLVAIFISSLMGGMAKGFVSLQNNASVPQAVLDSIEELKTLVVQSAQPRITAVRPASVVTNAVVPPKPPQPIVLVLPKPDSTTDDQSG